MTLAFQALLMMLLLVFGAVAFLPVLLLQPTPRASNPVGSGLQRPGLWLVENPKGQWFVNGTPHSLTDLQTLVQQQGAKQVIHYLPSDALPLESVTRSLRRLRSLAPGSVVLDVLTSPRPSR
jgi:hypothetical protein